MKSCLAMIIVLIIFGGFAGTLAVMYFASSNTEIESTEYPPPTSKNLLPSTNGKERHLKMPSLAKPTCPNTPHTNRHSSLNQTTRSS